MTVKELIKELKNLENKDIEILAGNRFYEIMFIDDNHDCVRIYGADRVFKICT